MADLATVAGEGENYPFSCRILSRASTVQYVFRKGIKSYDVSGRLTETGR